MLLFPYFYRTDGKFRSDGNKEFMVGKKENEHKIHSSNYEEREKAGVKST